MNDIDELKKQVELKRKKEKEDKLRKELKEELEKGTTTGFIKKIFKEIIK